jgi:hypothetical protein
MNFLRASALFGTGDLVRVSKHLGTSRAHPEYRASFRRCAGRVLPIAGWDRTGLVWLPLGRGEVVSVAPELLQLVRRHQGSLRISAKKFLSWTGAATSNKAVETDARRRPAAARLRSVLVRRSLLR